MHVSSSCGVLFEREGLAMGGGARRFGPPRPSQQVGTNSVTGKEVLQLGLWEPFNSVQASRLLEALSG